MKLKDYVDNYARMLGMFEPANLREYMQDVHRSGEYRDFERRILFDLYFRINQLNCYRVYDAILEAGFTPSDNHIFTMMKAAFKQHFGVDALTFTTAY